MSGLGFVTFVRIGDIPEYYVFEGRLLGFFLKLELLRL